MPTPVTQSGTEAPRSFPAPAVDEDATMADAEVSNREQATSFLVEEISAPAFGLQEAIISQANDGVDCQLASPSDASLDAVMDRLINAPRFLEQLNQQLVRTHEEPLRQPSSTRARDGRCVAVLNYLESVKSYCDDVGFPQPKLYFEQKCKRYRVTISVGQPPIIFSQPKAEGEYGAKKQVRDAAARDAWRYLVQVGQVIGSGYKASRTHGTNQGRKLPAPISTAYLGNLPARQHHLPGIFPRNDDKDTESDEDGYDPRSVAHSSRCNDRNQLTQIDGTLGNNNAMTVINPDRLRLLRNSSPVDESDFQIDFHPVKPTGSAETNANLAPLGPRKTLRLANGKASTTILPAPQLSVTDSRQGLYVPPQKRVRQDNASMGEGRASSMHQSVSAKANRLPLAGRPTPKNMSSLLARLDAMSAPLARVDEICKHVSIPPPQYFVMANDGDRVQWGAGLATSYLNAHEITLGPTALTWNEVLGKTMCARQFVEPHLLEAIRMCGFGSEDGAAMEVDDIQRASKRQRIDEWAANIRHSGHSNSTEQVHTDVARVGDPEKTDFDAAVDAFVNGVKAEMIKQEPED